MLKGTIKLLFQLAFIIFTILEIASIIGIIASLFVMIWIDIMLGIKILVSFYILYLVFKDMSDKSELIAGKVDENE